MRISLVLLAIPIFGLGAIVVLHRVSPQFYLLLLPGVGWVGVAWTVNRQSLLSTYADDDDQVQNQDAVETMAGIDPAKRKRKETSMCGWCWREITCFWRFFSDEGYLDVAALILLFGLVLVCSDSMGLSTALFGDGPLEFGLHQGSSGVQRSGTSVASTVVSGKN